MELTEDYIDSLNEKQKKAVLDDSSRICVVAGPGCGKTKTLVSKITFLILEKKLEKKEILVISFTKKAIREIKKRILNYVDFDIGNMQIYNFHSFCFFVLKKYSFFLGFNNNNFLIYDHYDQEQIIKKIIKENYEHIDVKEKFSIISFINELKCWKRNAGNECTVKEKKEIYEKYQEYLKKNNALDFNDIILYVIRLFTNFPLVLKEYQKQFSYILIDEFQDINYVQWNIVELILTEKQKIFLLCDPNQAIYSFQGASPELIFSFLESRDWKFLYLNVNYRSTNNIVNLSNSFIKENKNSLINNQLISLKEEGEKIKLFYCSSIEKIVVKEINFLISQKKSRFDEIAILYRNNYLCKKIECELIREGIPYEILGSFKFTERKEIRDIITILSFIIYKDDISFIRILELQEKIGKKTIEKIELINKKNENIFFSLSNKINKNLNIFSNLQKKKIIEIIKKVENWNKLFDSKLRLSEYFNMILNDFNYFNFFKKKDDYYKREKNIQHFFDIIRTWEEKKNFTSFFELISEFYQWIIISFEDKSLLKTYENLTLSSVHQAKGLEFKTIFFIYLDLGIIPFWKSIDIIEEKRIFYVGITRAKENLFLFSSVGRSSFFLKQIESKYLEKKIYLNL